MLYIMHRTQIYIDDDLWAILQARACKDRTSVSQLIRTAARERFAIDYAERAAAMQAFVGLRRDRSEFDDVDSYIRNLRDDRRSRALRGE